MLETQDAMRRSHAGKGVEMLGRFLAVLSALLFAGFAAPQQPPPAAADTQAGFPELPPHKTIQVNGAELAYVEMGRGEPVVLIHGFLGDYRIWSPQLRAFSGQFRVVAYSMRHRWPGRPPSEGTLPSPGTDAADLAALIEALRLAPVHLVGHSAGAGLALRVARDHPELVRSLVLGEPGEFAFAAGQPEAEPLFTPDLFEAMRQAYEAGDVERTLQLASERILGADPATRPLPAWAGQIFFDNAWQFPQMWTGGGPEPSLTCEQARRIQVPGLLLVGELSPAIFHRILDGLQECLPAAERAVLPDASHGLELENPDGFNQIVLGFLARLSAADRPCRLGATGLRWRK
jgi:non-heme chloroperoxidase